MTEISQPAFPVYILSQQARLSQEHLNTLFGTDYVLTPVSPSVTDDEFICAETVTFRTKDDSIADLRVIGPTVTQTSIRVARTKFLTLFPSRSDAGDVDSQKDVSLGGVLESKAGTVVLADGVASLKRHLLLNTAIAGQLSLSDQDRVSVNITGPVSRTLPRVLISVRSNANPALFVEPEETATLVVDLETRATLSNS